MSRIKNPQEKKRLSYEKDRRNCYGENNKSSRKSIRRNKKLSARHFRTRSSVLARLEKHGLDDGLADEAQTQLLSLEKESRLNGFKKVPDQALKDHIEQQQAWRVRRHGRKSKP